MRKILFALAAILCCLTASGADTLRVGNCHGELATNGYETTAANQWVETAMMVSKETAHALTGNEIRQVRVGLTNRVNIDTVKVWVRTALDGENLAEGYVTTRTQPNIKRGWNVITFAQPYTITGTQPLYVGYSFKQRKATQTVSVVGDPNEHSFLLKDGGDWQDLSNKGSLSLEAVVVGDKLTQYDLGIEWATAKKNSSTGEVTITASLYNYGAQTITGTTLTASLQGTDEKYTYHYAEPIDNGATATVTFTITPKASGVGTEHVLNLEITALDNGTDQDASNNSAPAAFSFARKVLIEEFTGEDCPNCPRVAEYLHTTLGKSKYANRVYGVCHHSGYYDDWLTTEADKQYVWLYNSGSYAPAVMYNRFPFFETSKLKPTPVHMPNYQSDMETGVDYLLESDAYAFLNLRAELDKDNPSKVKVYVDGQRSKVLTTALSCITVYLTEDHVKAVAQYGPNGKIADYYHDHVLRAYNSAWGEEINWTDNKFEYTYEFTVDETWNTSNLNLVAFINSYDKTDPSNCIIENVESVPFPSAESAIREVKAHATNQAPAYYNLDGTRIQQPAKGLYIERNADGTTHKILK